MENNNLNMFKMFSQLSETLAANNPELKDLIPIIMSGSMKTSKEILDYLVKKYPQREKEIRE